MSKLEFFTEESFKIIGCAYRVYNELKYGFHEKYYQRALEIEFQKIGFQVVREKPLIIRYKNEIIGKYFLDFLINNEIVVECKVGSDFHSQHIKQVLAYLKTFHKRLGLILLFAPDAVRIKRLLN